MNMNANAKLKHFYVDCHPFSDKIWWLLGRVDCLRGLRPTEYCKGSIKWLHRSQLRGVQWQYSGVAQDKTGGERRVSLLCSVCLGKLAWSSSVWGWDTASVVCQAETGKLSIDSQDSQTALRQAGKELWCEQKIKTLISWETSSSNNAINVEKQPNIFYKLFYIRKLYYFIWFLLIVVRILHLDISKDIDLFTI